MFPSALAVYSFDVTKHEAITEEALQDFQFTPVLSTESASQGLTQVQGSLAYLHQGSILSNFTFQKKSVPASAVKIALANAVAADTKASGFPTNKRRRKELKNQIIEEFNARAIPVTKSVPFWLDLKAGRVMIGSVSGDVIDAVNSLLYQVAGIEMRPINLPGDSTLTDWLGWQGDDARDVPSKLTVDDFVVFQHPGEEGKTVRYDHTNLADSDVLANPAAGAVVTSLALTFDDKLSFVLTEGVIKRIKPLGVLSEKVEGETPEEVFDNNFYLAATELSALITYLEQNA